MNRSDLPWVDTQLAAESQLRRMCHVVSEPARVAQFGGDPVKWCAPSRGSGAKYHGAARVLKCVLCIWVHTKLGAQIDAAESRAHHCLASTDLRGRVDPDGRLDERHDRCSRRQPTGNTPDLRNTVRLGNHHRCLVAGKHFQVVVTPWGVRPVHPHHELNAGADQIVVHRRARSVLVGDRNGVLQVQDNDVRAAGEGLGKSIGPVAGDEQDAARGGDPLGETAQRNTAGLWAATIFSTTIFAVSAHAVVPPLAYSLTPSPTFHSPANGVSWVRS